MHKQIKYFFYNIMQANTIRVNIYNFVIKKRYTFKNMFSYQT